ncbi:hypothetical protein Rumeso_03032 [Rubellimicrobium mesophilum DSM 19309]|uniref:TubC N-terminal docking domain-containing protein n=1 Tax=Rubellimicrobium mesophilum DSM 19309 TaxID=442562 RepID=A0A017HM34_9RHOB|nr:hypothetical protein [Rubellimicrobium mesophilum]EYD75385.1 hypothetical protein Rumeso_03032 [Rubellimicrobium mesophilum DSM 19309]
MSAALALKAAREAGLQLQVEGEDLILEAAAPPPAPVLERLRQHKAEVIGLLRREAGTWSTEDWQAFYDERAGIAEHDGGLLRPEAEVQAFESCVAEWRNQHPVGSAANCCLHCGGPDTSAEPLVPFGIEPTGPAWLHHRCWDAWYAGRRDRAVAALAAMGITDGGTSP